MIDYEAIIEDLRTLALDDCSRCPHEYICKNCSEYLNEMLIKAADAIEHLTENLADAVNVVRCINCKHYLGLAECEIEWHICGGTNWFCADGEQFYTTEIEAVDAWNTRWEAPDARRE